MPAIRDILNGNFNPQVLYVRMYQENPDFKAFADSMNGKSPEQAFREAGYDFNQFRNLMPR